MSATEDAAKAARWCRRFGGDVMRGPTSAFVDALLGSSLPVITEVKRRDGHGNELMGERTVEEVVRQYLDAGAPCISVVTGKWFGGEDQMLRDAAALTDRPLLKKDFITRERQVADAKEMGASAVLLTAQLLPKNALPKMIEIALDNGLTPFVEVTDEAELARVIRPDECVIAINNKNIQEQERDRGDIDTSRALLEPAIEAGTPCPVSASAISDPKTGAELVAAGFKGLLVGTGLLVADSIQGWVDELRKHLSTLDAPAPTSAGPR